MHSKQKQSIQPLGLYRGRGFEGFMVRTKPDCVDPLTTHPLIDATGYSLNLWQFRHRSIVESFSL
jgi:hypothetical protein